MRDSEAIELLSAMGDPDSADIDSALRGAFGATDDQIDALHDVGGPVSFSERRFALHNTRYDDLVSYRDLFLAHQTQATAALPAAVRYILEPTLSDPIASGLIIASVVLDVAAMTQRDAAHEAADTEEAGEQLA